MNTKAFYDNDRLVIVIENCDKEVEKKLFDYLKPDVVSPVAAAPTALVKESEKVAKQTQEPSHQMPYVEPEHASPHPEEVPSGGATVSLQDCLDILRKPSNELSSSSDRTYAYIIDKRVKKEDGMDSEEIGNILKEYLIKRFKSVKVEEVIPKFDDKTCSVFVHNFGSTLTNYWHKNYNVQISDFQTFSLEDKQRLIASGINYFKTLKK